MPQNLKLIADSIIAQTVGRAGGAPPGTMR